MVNKEFFTYQGQEHPFYIAGEGPIKILVLHGWDSSIVSWNNFFTLENQAQFTFYFPELPGFGNSPKPKRAWNVQDYTDYSRAFYKSLKQKPDYLLTHSLGGRIAIKWLSSGECVFKHVFMVAAAGIKPRRSLVKSTVKNFATKLKKYQEHKVLAKPLGFVKKVVVKLLKAHDYQKAHGVMRATFLKVIDEDLSPYLKNVSCPVELIWGRHDTYTPLYMGRKMNKLIPNSHLTIIKNARHGVHLQTPVKLAKIIDDLIPDIK